MGSKKPDAPGPGLFDRMPTPAQPAPPSSSAPRPARERRPREEAPERVPARPEPPRALSVTELTDAIKERLTGLGVVQVEGEISGFKRASAGHFYFDLKDDRGARLACKIWRSRTSRACATEPKDGQFVRCTGRLDVYAPHGGYSMIVDRLEAQGIGAMLAKLEELKRELAGRGWFERSRPLPTMPGIIGVVTSRDGAALRDFLRTRSQRWSGYPVRIAHTPVQGPGAAREIAGAIDAMAASGVDVVVVTRGGGSLEDLWAFNEQAVAEAIWRSPVPVVSAVGHETDVCLSDFVADHRAHTPTDAAQTVIPDRRALAQRVGRAGNYLMEAMGAALDEREARLLRAAGAHVLRDPMELLRQRQRALIGSFRRLESARAAGFAGTAERLHRAGAGLERSGPRRWLERTDRRLAEVAAKLVPWGGSRLDRAAERLALLQRTLEAVGPLAVLKRGYAIVTDADGAVVSDATAAEAGQALDVRLARGSLEVNVERARAPEKE